MSFQTKSVDAAAGGLPARLKNLRVLFVPGGSTNAFIHTVMASARSHFNWTVESPDADPARFCERQAWEDDDTQIAAIDALIRDCEVASGVSAGRILLAGERDLGRGFSTLHFNAPQNAISRRATADIAEPFRILRRMFVFAREMIDRARPDLVMATGWGESLSLVFYLVARQRGIACAAIRPSSIWKGRLYWADRLMSFNLPAQARAGEKRAANAPLSPNAQSYIAAFRSGSVAATGKVSRRSSQARYFHRFDPKTLADFPYIYLALHEDPSEALNLQAPFWANQYNTAALLTGSLPAGYKLLVHEHRANIGRRPRQYYADLSRLPGLVLIDGDDPRFNYVANAALVVTENGPAGWEGLLLGRPVITLADNFYQGAGLARRIRNPEDLSATLVDALRPAIGRDDADDMSALGWMLDAEWETTAAPADEAALFGLLSDCLSHSAQPGLASMRIGAVS